MPASSGLDIEHVATLARIALTADEKARFSAQLGDVLAYIEQLRKADVAGVEATAHAFAVTNVFAEDVAQAGLPPAEALRNAPAVRDQMFVVPKVVE